MVTCSLVTARGITGSLSSKGRQRLTEAATLSLLLPFEKLVITDALWEHFICSWEMLSLSFALSSFP